MINVKEETILAIKKHCKTWGIFVCGFCFAGILLDINPIVVTFLVSIISGGIMMKIIGLLQIGFALEENPEEADKKPEIDAENSTLD